MRDEFLFKRDPLQRSRTMDATHRAIGSIARSPNSWTTTLGAISSILKAPIGVQRDSLFGAADSISRTMDATHRAIGSIARPPNSWTTTLGAASSILKAPIGVQRDSLFGAADSISRTMDAARSAIGSIARPPNSWTTTLGAVSSILKAPIGVQRDSLFGAADSISRTMDATHRAIGSIARPPNSWTTTLGAASSILKAPIGVQRDSLFGAADSISRTMDAARSAIGSIARPPNSWTTTLGAASSILKAPIRVQPDALSKTAAEIWRTVKQFFRKQAFERDLREAGWLPYYTIHPDYIEDCGHDTALIDARITSFYKNHWDSIRNDIASRLGHYQISEEAKATLLEALDAHGRGHYRCVSRVLFPDIEKELRAYAPEQTGSGKRLVHAILSRAFKAFKTHWPRKAYGWILYCQLADHLYANVDENNIETIRLDYVPNRHAAIHGLVSYETHKHSMNMLIMADYIFQVLTSIAMATAGEEAQR